MDGSSGSYVVFGLVMVLSTGLKCGATMHNQRSPK
jgi:hypothetical protein